MSRGRVVAVTLGVMFSLFMASMESTVVATAMPTIISQIGGFDSYSWVFSVYMLTSTTTVPVFGKLSDVYGRRPVYMVAVALFLLGSLLCGQARTIEQLIAFRAVQGLGAGGLLPLAFIIIGDLFTLAQRARLQGLFSGVWGVSSIVGPLLGGFLVDQVSWPWVFLVNLVPGAIAALLVWFGWPAQAKRASARPSIDYAGAFLLTAGVVALMLGLFELQTPAGWALLGAAALLLAGLALVERRAADPVLPLALFRDRLFAIACAHGVLAGCAMFGSTAFIPLFVQSVLGTSATAAGAALTPMLLAWVVASIVGSRLLLRVSYRTLALAGMVALVVGSVVLAAVGPGSSQALLMAATGLMGVGMGLSIPAFLIAVQSTVARERLGTATSTLQFSRSIGGTIGVSVMGALLASRLAANLAAAGVDPAAVSVDSLLSPLPQQGGEVAVEGALRTALGSAIQSVFLIALVAAVLGLLVTALAPRRRLQGQSAASAPAAPAEATTQGD